MNTTSLAHVIYKHKCLCYLLISLDTHQQDARGRALVHLLQPGEVGTPNPGWTTPGQPCLFVLNKDVKDVFCKEISQGTVDGVGLLHLGSA